MKVLLSIKEEFASKIFSGEKRFEYRKCVPKNPVTKMVVYVTMPIGKIIGEFTIAQIHKESPQTLWNKTQNYSGIKKDSFFEYFKGKSFGYAIEVKDYILYDIPVDPYCNFGKKKFVAPQSFKYI